MSDFVIAQAMGEYGGLGSITTTVGQLWSLLESRASSLDYTTWLMIAGAALVLMVVWGLRPPPVA